MNPSTALATVIVNALVELGVRQVVLCPGSRSAPLAYALAAAADAGELQLQVRLDERSAGFLALGLALGSGAPAAVITTSGTAVANLHPAVLEATHAGVPLLVISADRPHELRGTGASQTTDQVKLFGDAVRWFGEIPAPQRQSGLAPGWRNVVARAVAAASGNPGSAPGPVQLNVAFADPLLPDVPDADPDASETETDDWPDSLTGTTGLTRIAPAPPFPPVIMHGCTADERATVHDHGGVLGGGRTVVLAGDGAGADAAVLAEKAGWPLLAEPSSGSRIGAAIGPYRLLLDHPELGARIERVVVFGRPTLSRPVSRLLARPGVEVIVVSTRPDWTDAARRAALVTPAVDVETPDPDRQWYDAWQQAGQAAARAIDQILDDEAAAGRLTGPLIARELAAATEAGDVLFAGSSNPIRDLDLAAAPFPAGARVLANRGLAGIDGTLSSAAGVALALGGSGQVRCLVGDLTFLHDAGGLLTGALEQRPDLQIVVVDDAGGGIFSTLEHGGLARTGPARLAVFERVFGTPQDVDLAALCAGYRVGHELIDDVESLRKALAQPPTGISVLHLQIDRKAHPDLAARLKTAATRATVHDHGKN
jgi:2-succinyl-5-enolpyruvyl-6-hydroxy-3-cyclohexene-1-carboxylate synthase